MRIPTRRGDRVLVRAAHALVLVPARFRLDAVACVDECGAVGRADRRWQMPAAAEAPAPRLEPISNPRPLTRPAAQDEMDIPAFLRRQSN